MEERKIEAGKDFKFKGYKWRILDPDYEGGILCVMAENWKDKEFAFDENGGYGCNNYAKSSIRKMLNSELLEELGEESLIEKTADLLADNGDDAYGTVRDKVSMLSLDEYRKYKKVMPKWDNWTWLCTPWYCYGQTSGYGYSVRSVNPDGSVNYIDAYYAHGVAPACVFNRSIFESPRKRHAL